MKQDNKDVYQYQYIHTPKQDKERKGCAQLITTRKLTANDVQMLLLNTILNNRGTIHEFLLFLCSSSIMCCLFLCLHVFILLDPQGNELPVEYLVYF